eukprot:scaffold114869_cov90-Phaeocystis_antarctica.AAC.3
MPPVCAARPEPTHGDAGRGCRDCCAHSTARPVAQHNATRRIYRTSVPGHSKCQEARAPLQHRYVPQEGHAFHWDDVEAHDAVRRSRFEALLPGRVRYIDAATIANARADRHMIQGRWGGRGSVDCLHYCLPGPPDTYNLVLKRLLRESSPRELPTFASDVDT